MVLLRSQSISYFNLKRIIWLKENYLALVRAYYLALVRTVDRKSKGRGLNPARGQISQCLFLAAVVLTALCGCRSGNP